MKILTKLTTDDLISSLKFYASILITNNRNAFYLLKKLNYDEGVSPHDSKIIAQRIENLFGTTYDDAKVKYSSRIL